MRYLFESRFPPTISANTITIPSNGVCVSIYMCVYAFVSVVYTCVACVYIYICLNECIDVYVSLYLWLCVFVCSFCLPEPLY